MLDLSIVIKQGAELKSIDQIRGKLDPPVVFS